MNKFKYEDIENEIKKIFIELLELIIMIEDAFEIAIPEEKLNTDLLESVKSLTDYVYSLLQDK